MSVAEFNWAVKISRLICGVWVFSLLLKIEWKNSKDTNLSTPSHIQDKFSVQEAWAVLTRQKTQNSRDNTIFLSLDIENKTIFLPQGLVAARLEHNPLKS